MKVKNTVSGAWGPVVGTVPPRSARREGSRAVPYRRAPRPPPTTGSRSPPLRAATPRSLVSFETWTRRETHSETTCSTFCRNKHTKTVKPNSKYQYLIILIPKYLGISNYISILNTNTSINN